MRIVKVIKMQNNLIGFFQEQESLPYFFDHFNNKEKLRQLFLSLSSSLIKEYYIFSKYEQKTLCKYTFEEIFKYKINSLKAISYIKPFVKKESFIFCLHSTLIINNYVNKEMKKQIYASSKLLPMAKVIATCFINNKLQLFFDKNLLFHEYVLNKIRKMHKNNKVLDNGDSICIFKENYVPLKIYTSWKKIDPKNLKIEDDINTAINSIKQSEFKQVYLVYPKLENFNRHIQIKVDELEDKNYEIKVVPYSLRSIIRNIQG